MKSSVYGSFKPYKENSVRTKSERKSSSIGEAANDANNQPKKLIRRESCDSHNANIQYLPSKPSNSLNGYEAANRNNKMKENLHSKNLTTVEINADGN